MFYNLDVEEAYLNMTQKYVNQKIDTFYSIKYNNFSNKNYNKQW